MIVETIHEGTYMGEYSYRPVSLRAYFVRQNGNEAEIASYRNWALAKGRTNEVDFMDGLFDIEWRDGACARCNGLGYAHPQWKDAWVEEGGYHCFDCTARGIKPGRGMVIVNHIDDEIRADEAYRRDALGEFVISTDTVEAVNWALWGVEGSTIEFTELCIDRLRNEYAGRKAAGLVDEANYLMAAGQYVCGLAA